MARKRVTFRQAMDVTRRQWGDGVGSDVTGWSVFLMPLHATWYWVAGVPVRDPER